MDERQQYLSTLSYAEEQEVNATTNTMEMLNIGIKPEHVEDNFSMYAANKTPTFASSPETNKSLQNIMTVAEILKDQDLRQDPAMDKLYKDYLDFRVESAINQGGFVYKAYGAARHVLKPNESFPVKERDLDLDSVKGLEWLKALNTVHETAGETKKESVLKIDSYLPEKKEKTLEQDLGTLGVLSEVSGIVVDTIALQGLLGGDIGTVTKAIRTGNKLKANSLIGRAVASKFIAKTSVDGANLTKGFLTAAKFTGQLAEDLAIGTSYSLLNAVTDGGDLRPSEIAKDFGVGLGADLALNVVASIAAPQAKNLGRIFFKSNKGAFTKGSMKTIDDAVSAGLDAIQGKVDPTLIKNMRRQGLNSSASILEEVQGDMLKVKTLKDAGLNNDAMMKVYALASGMKMDIVDGTYQVTENFLSKYGKAKTSIKKVATLEEVADLIDKKQLQGLKRNTLQNASAASMTKDIKVQQVYEGTIKSPNAKIDLVEFGSTVVPRTGSFNGQTKGQAFKFVKTAINELGEGTTKNLDNLDVKLADDFFKVLPNHKSDTLLLPRQIKSANELTKYTDYVGKFITHHGEDINKEALEGILQGFGKATGSWSFSDIGWISAQASKIDSKIAVKEGVYYLDDGINVMAFDSQDLLGNHVFAKTITDDNFADFLKVEKNFSMAKDEDGLLRVYNQAKSPVADGRTVEEIMANNPQLRPKLPIETAPKFNFITDSTRQVQFNGDYIEGSVDQINNYFDNYTSMKHMADLKDSKTLKHVKKADGTKVHVNVDKRKYIVTADRYGMRPQTFKTEASLKKFLDQIDTPQKATLKSAGTKGVNVIADKAGYIVAKAGSPDQVFKTFEEASEYVASLPNKPLTPEMLEKAAKETRMAEELYGSVFKDMNLEGFSENQNVALLKESLRKTDKINNTVKKTSRIGVETKALFNKFRGARGQVYSMMKGTPEAVPVAKAFDDLLEVEKQMKVINTRFSGAMAGLEKLVPKKDRANLGNLLSKELPEEMWDERYLSMTGETLSSDQRKFLTGVRSMFDQAGELNGFGDSLDRIENYFSRMKTLEPSAIFSGKATSVSLMETVFDRPLTKVETKFFENMRTIDLAAYAFENDPLKLVQRYVDDTMKSTLLEPAIINLNKIADDVLPDGHNKNTIKKIARHAKGLSEDEATEQLKKATNEIALSMYQKTADGYAKAHGFNKKSKEVSAFMKGKFEEVSTESIAKMTPEQQEVFANAIQKKSLRQNPLNKVFGAVTLGTQAFKPWLPIRNTFQPETHLAPLFGLDAVASAKKQVSEMSDEAYEYLANKGIFQTKSILAETGLTGSGKVAKLNEVGLMAYKASDDFDRAVGFTVIRNRLAEALEASTDFGRQSGDYFAQHTKLYAAPQHIREGVIDAIAKGDIEDATVQYAQWMNDMTFLNYSSINRPEAFNTLFGKMFGQMGTFSTQTFESRKYFLENLTKADVASYTARAVLGGFALNSAWSEITGTEVNNFSPVQSMIFAGGPTIDTLVATRDILGGQAYKQKQGISTIKNQLKNVYSPFATVQNLYEGFDRVLEGDTTEGIQQLLSLPAKGSGSYSDPTALELIQRAL